jgi:uncharacterized paraquat-inducible protein A
MNTESFPSLPEQGKNLAKFTFDVVKDVVSVSRPVFVSEEKQKERLSVCKTCDYYSPKQKRCKKCGCFLTHKVQFEVSQCPVGKW